jgi:hypothetical protein
MSASGYSHQQRVLAAIRLSRNPRHCEIKEIDGVNLHVAPAP